MSKRIRNIYSLLLIIIIFSTVLNNYFWLKIDKFPPTGNALQDLFPGINLYLDITHHRVTLSKIIGDMVKPLIFQDIFAPRDVNYVRLQFFIYPPLAPISFSFFYFLFGANNGMERLVNTFYLIFAMLAIYGIGKKIANEKVGVLAVFIFSSFPGIIIHSRTIYAEFDLMCMIAITMFFLLKTEFFTIRKYSVILGVFLGLTALTKWEFPITIFAPFCLYAISSHFIIKKRAASASVGYIWLNFSISVSVGVLISLFWYLLSFKDIIWRLTQGPGGNAAAKEYTLLFNSGLLQRFSYYPLAIINSFISLFYFLFLVLAVISFIYLLLRNKSHLSEIKGMIFYGLFLLLWIIIPCLILSCIDLCIPSHTMPMLPAIALVISLGIFSLRNRILRLIFILLVVLFGVGAYTHSVINFGKMDIVYKLKLYLGKDSRFRIVRKTDNFSRDALEFEAFYPPRTKDWQFNAILSYIKEDSYPVNSHPTVFVLGSHYFNCFGFQYYNLLRGYQLFIEPRGNDRSPQASDRSRFDYVVIHHFKLPILDNKALSEIIKVTLNIERAHNIDKFKKDFFNRYKLVKEYTLPDTTKAQIYKLEE